MYLKSMKSASLMLLAVSLLTAGIGAGAIQALAGDRPLIAKARVLVKRPCRARPRRRFGQRRRHIPLDVAAGSVSDRAR